MSSTDLKRSIKSYILRLYGTPENGMWSWRFVLTSLQQGEKTEQGFQSLDELVDYLGVEINHVENNDEPLP